MENRNILRTLAERYSEIANLEIQKKRMDRYEKTINLNEVRPVVLIDEVPWGEIADEALVNRCENGEPRRLEQRLRRSLYQWDHFQADLVIPPVFQVEKKIISSGIGLDVEEVVIRGTTGTDIAAHEYKDQLKTEDDLEKLKLPVLTYDKAGTEKAAELAADVFSGLMPVEVTGIRGFGYAMWDSISERRGVDNLLLDLALRPDFMHKTVRKFKEIAVAMARQCEELNIMDPNPLTLHCTPAYTHELPAADFTGKVRLKDVWGRCHAQILSAVSPDMHDEFDLAYNQDLFGECGQRYIERERLAAL